MSFSNYVERKGTDSKKWDLNGMLEMASYADDESIPMWVADMDFKAPEFVQDALLKRVEHGVFGYNTADKKYYEGIKFWLKNRNDWDIEESWIVPTSGVVPALCYAIKAFTEHGDGVVVQNPVYPPFRNSVEINGREVVSNPLKLAGDRYEMDFDDLEKKLANPKNKMLILCSPHNPIGRVWTKNELEKVVSLCLKYKKIIVSDEIHSDLILFKNKFVSVGTLDREIKKYLIVCTSISKTFNLAGLKASNIIIPDSDLRERFINEMSKVAAKPVPNIFGAIAMEQCYSKEGERWLEDLIVYLEDNYLFLKDYLEKRLPKIKCFPLEGTYLAWIDFRELNLTEEELRFKLEEEAKIVTDGGGIFGAEGVGFIRLNFACHRSVLEKALERLEKSFENI